MADHLLRLSRVVSNQMLCRFGGTRSLLASELLDLFGLLRDNGGNIFNLRINDLFVGLVNQRSEEEDCGCQEGKTPEWNNLDEVIGDECTDEGLLILSALQNVKRRETHSNRGEDILGE